MRDRRCANLEIMLDTALDLNLGNGLRNPCAAYLR
jgi:hypothetical protein